MAGIQEFLSKWQSNLVKHEGQLTSMQQTLLQYLHKHDAITGGTESTALQRLLSHAREHVLAPLKVRMHDLCDSSSELDIDYADAMPDLADEADQTIGTAKVPLVPSGQYSPKPIYCSDLWQVNRRHLSIWQVPVGHTRSVILDGASGPLLGKQRRSVERCKR